MELYREPNIERAIEVFTVARVLDPAVDVYIVNMPEPYRLVFKDELSNSILGNTVGVIHYMTDTSSKINSKYKMEPLEEVKSRITKYSSIASSVVESDFESLVKKNTASVNLLKIAAERLSLKTETVYAICSVSAAVSILAEKFPEIRVEHLAEAIQYYSDMVDPVKDTIEKLNSLEGLSPENQSLVDACIKNLYGMGHF